VRTIAIINQKGGCGKTTTAINLAAELARARLRTLLVDMDPQSHAAAGLGVPESKLDLDVTDALLTPPGKPAALSRMLWNPVANLDLLPSRVRLAGLEAPRGGLAEAPDKEHRLRSLLAGSFKGYDVAVIDCSPAIGLLTFNALAAADTVLIPVETGYFSLQGAFKQLNTVRTLARRLGAQPTVRVLATLHDPANAVANDLLAELRKRFGPKLAPVIIRYDPRLREAVSFGKPINEYAPQSSGAHDYRDLARWAIELLHGAARPADSPSVDIDPGEGWDEGRPAIVSITGESSPTVNIVAGPGAEAALTPRAVPLTRSDPAVADASARVMSRIEEVARRAITMQRSLGEAQPTREQDTGPRASTLCVQPEPKPLPPTESIRRLFGARATGQGLLFVQPLGIGRQVFVAGEFNDWSPSVNPMRRNESLGIFELLLPVKPGRHRYRLVVDGVWLADPHNPEAENNPYGSADSVALMPESSVPGSLSAVH
jgi:chromosome partitioning protein